jgi:hypothetical protein
VEADRHPGLHPLDGELGTDADDGIVRPGHPCVRDRRGAAGEHARVVRLHVRVRAEDGGDPAVEHARERDLLARRLRVEVDQDDRRPRPGLVDELVDDAEGMDRRGEEERALEVEDGHLGSVLRLPEREPGAGDPGVAEVRGARDARARLEHRDEVAVPPDVVACRDHVGARGEELLGELGGEADAVRGVLAVDDAEVDPELVPELGQPLRDGAPAWRPEDVTDEEDLQLDRSRSS